MEICLTNWINRGLVVEMDADNGERGDTGRASHRYRFSHGFLWQVVLEDLAQLQRERLNERIEAVRTGKAVNGEPARPIRRVIEEEGGWGASAV